jgi:hypothetical protein
MSAAGQCLLEEIAESHPGAELRPQNQMIHKAANRFLNLALPWNHYTDGHIIMTAISMH